MTKRESIIQRGRRLSASGPRPTLPTRGVSTLRQNSSICAVKSQASRGQLKCEEINLLLSLGTAQVKDSDFFGNLPCNMAEPAEWTIVRTSADLKTLVTGLRQTLSKGHLSRITTREAPAKANHGHQNSCLDFEFELSEFRDGITPPKIADRGVTVDISGHTRRKSPQLIKESCLLSSTQSSPPHLHIFVPHAGTMPRRTWRCLLSLLLKIREEGAIVGATLALGCVAEMAVIERKIGLQRRLALNLRTTTPQHHPGVAHRGEASRTTGIRSSALSALRGSSPCCKFVFGDEALSCAIALARSYASCNGLPRKRSLLCAYAYCSLLRMQKTNAIYSKSAHDCHCSRDTAFRIVLALYDLAIAAGIVTINLSLTESALKKHANTDKAQISVRVFRLLLCMNIQ